MARIPFLIPLPPLSFQPSSYLRGRHFPQIRLHSGWQLQPGGLRCLPGHMRRRRLLSPARPLCPKAARPWAVWESGVPRVKKNKACWEPRRAPEACWDEGKERPDLSFLSTPSMEDLLTKIPSTFASLLAFRCARERPRRLMCSETPFLRLSSTWILGRGRCGILNVCSIWTFSAVESGSGVCLCVCVAC